MSVHITLEFTPNPETLKYVVSQRLMERGALSFQSAAQAEGAPLAQGLLGIEGVSAVMIAPEFVTITVADPKRMMDVNALVPDYIKEHLEAGKPVITDALPTEEHGTDDSDIARRIKTILDEQVRPAVAMDGGDIVFNRFEEGVVYLELKGSCAGCPSSTATLKMGIEQHLREVIPEVEEVQAI